MKYRLALDIGTTTVKAMLFDNDLEVINKSERKLDKSLPQTGWVEQDPMELVQKSRGVLQEVVNNSGVRVSDCVLGITNQRETTIVWNVLSNQPIYPAIVWEDSRTDKWCQSQSQELKNLVLEKTGLPLIAYFSVSKIRWLLDHIIGDINSLKFGTVDSWLIWNLLKNKPHLTDITNASRTLLFDIFTKSWSSELIEKFDIPMSVLPKVMSSVADFGVLDISVLGHEIPLTAVCGDQQASMFAAMNYNKDKFCTKVTCGTGTFIMQTCNAYCAVPNGWFKTITPNINGDELYALETKIECGARDVDKLILAQKPLEPFLYELARLIVEKLRGLPNKPKKIILDGGVSRDGLIAEYISELTGIEVQSLPIFDGTSLGIASLCQQKD